MVIFKFAINFPKGGQIWKKQGAKKFCELQRLASQSGGGGGGRDPNQNLIVNCFSSDQP